jgi:hypothetical protein
MESAAADGLVHRVGVSQFREGRLGSEGDLGNCCLTRKDPRGHLLVELPISLTYNTIREPLIWNCNQFICDCLAGLSS